jgi:DNA-binding beta-propeller fold protein YncE
VAVTSGAPTARVKVGKWSHHLSMSPDGRWLYVTRSAAGRVAVVDAWGLTTSRLSTLRPRR